MTSVLNKPVFVSSQQLGFLEKLRVATASYYYIPGGEPGLLLSIYLDHRSPTEFEHSPNLYLVVS